MIKPSLGLIGLCTTALAMVAATFVAVDSQAASDLSQPITFSVTDDTYVRAGLPFPMGLTGALVVGGPAEAVTYLKFQVPTLPPGTGALRATLTLDQLQIAGNTSPIEIDVHTVNDTTWSEDSMTSTDAPTVGPVVASATLKPAASVLHFTVSSALAGTGEIAFALTAAPAEWSRVFASKEARGPAGGPRLTVVRVGGPTPPPTGPPTSPPPTGNCTVNEKLVPSCGVMLGVAPAAHTGTDPADALTAFESQVQHGQDIYHSYHRGVSSMFPNAEEISIANQPGHNRALFINWRPQVASWASVAAGNPTVDAYLDKLATYIKSHFTRPFFFTVQHEPENDVVETPGSGYTAADFAQMYRHVILRLRGDGVTNLVTVVDYMAYAPWNTKPWFNDLYPGDDVVDWIGWDMYGYSQPGKYGYGDFAEMLTRGESQADWQGIYSWAASRFPTKPFMVAEWGIWYNAADPNHQAEVYDSVAAELEQFPQIKALVYFDTPSDSSSSRSSLVSTTSDSLDAYRALSNLPEFQVDMGSD
jgi:Glycosyl hydrolase family 26